MFGINEEEYAKELIKKNIRKQIEKKKDKLLQKLLESKSSQEIEDLQYKLKELDDELEYKIKNIEPSVNEAPKSFDLVKEFAIFHNKYVDDNNIAQYRIDLKANIESYCQFFKADDHVDTLVDLYKILRKDAHKYKKLFIPLFLWNQLFNYQQEAISWFYDTYEKEEGVILADEMGLGKTLQTITFLASMYISEAIKYVLILCPTTIIDQWILEWKKYFPFTRICVIHKNYTDHIKEVVKSINEIPCVVIMSYDGFKNYHKSLDKTLFDYIVLDEGHKIKNKETLINKAIYDFRCINKIVLTGTPIQNNLKELWSIFNFINPGKLGSYNDFCEEYEEPIQKGQYTNATRETIDRAYKRNILLKNIVDPYILRRLKSQVAGQLPPKVDNVLFCKLTNVQELLYKQELESDAVYKILLGKRSCMAGLIALRKICNHPYLYRHDEKFLDQIIHCSCKMIQLMKMLVKWKFEGKKVLIFTQMIETMDLIEIILSYNNYKYLKMSGKTSLSQRSKNISHFNTDKDIFVFLLTTRVGGLGLNLIGASRIIIFDPDWNPSTDSQAKERAWRYGQKNDVETYRFVTMDTIEEKIYERQVFKNVLTNKVLTKPTISKLFDKSSINDLFSYYRQNKKERIEKMIENGDEPEEDLFENEVDEITKEKTRFLRKKEVLTDEEMIEFINLREEHEL